MKVNDIVTCSKEFRNQVFQYTMFSPYRAYIGKLIFSKSITIQGISKKADIMFTNCKSDKGYFTVPLFEDGTLADEEVRKVMRDPLTKVFVEDTANVTLIAPNNNDGRTNCYWCNGKTYKVSTGFSIMDICSVCKK